MVVSAFSIFNKRDEKVAEGKIKPNSSGEDAKSPEGEVQEPFIPTGKRATFFKRRVPEKVQQPREELSSLSSSDSESSAAADKWVVDKRPPPPELTPSKLSLFMQNDSSDSEANGEISIDKQNVLALVAQTTLSQRAENGEGSGLESEVELSAAENEVNDVISIGSEDETAEEHEVYDADERDDDEVSSSQAEQVEEKRPWKRIRTRSVKTETPKRTKRYSSKRVKKPLPPSSPPSSSVDLEEEREESKPAKSKPKQKPQKPKKEQSPSSESGVSEYYSDSEPDLEVLEVKNLEEEPDISLIDAKDFEPNEKKSHKERKRILRHSTYVSRKSKVRNRR